MSGRVNYLGEFEQVVMLAVIRLGDEAYGTNIRREIEARSGRQVTIGATYVTLDRLEEKGYIRSQEGSPSAERSGRVKRFFTVTSPGTAALEAAREMQARMWAGIRLRKTRKA